MNDVTITLLFLAFTIILYVTEKIPLALTSMIVCVGLNLTGVLTIKEAFEGFVNGNVILFLQCLSSEELYLKQVWQVTLEEWLQNLLKQKNN